MRIDGSGKSLRVLAAHAYILGGQSNEGGVVGEHRRARARVARLALAGLAGATAASALPPAPVVPPFSSAPTTDGTLPDGWEPLEFPRIPSHTRYELVNDAGVRVVRATSRASASGLIFRVRVDLGVHPILRWRWKVDGVLERGDVSSRSGDDYPARVYVTFEYDPERVGWWKRIRYRAARQVFGDLPIGAINYIWASRAPRGAVVDNVYSGGFVKMIVVESGPARAGQWREEARNVYEDFIDAFGEEPPLVNGVAVMTDTDNTGEAAVAYYGDIEFQAAFPDWYDPPGKRADRGEIGRSVEDEDSD